LFRTHINPREKNTPEFVGCGGLQHVTHFAKPTCTESEKFGETMAGDEQRQLGVAVGVERCRSGDSDGPIAGARGSTDEIPFQPLNFSKRSPRKVPSKSELRKWREK
jgi:hypothetical protein